MDSSTAADTSSSSLLRLLPDVDEGTLRLHPCVRFEDLLPPVIAGAVEQEVAHGLEYERVELGEMTAQWRAARPLGDVYFGQMRRHAGWETPQSVKDVLSLFESPGFIDWLGRLAGEQLEFLRPVTAYRLERGDRICLHDDMSDPNHAVSVAYNLSRDWVAGDGGGTIFGRVTGVTPLSTPFDSPIPLQRWEIADAQRFVPAFNSLLVMRLGEEFAHGVETVTGNRSRLSLVGIYGRC